MKDNSQTSHEIHFNVTLSYCTVLTLMKGVHLISSTSKGCDLIPLKYLNILDMQVKAQYTKKHLLGNCSPLCNVWFM